MLIKCGVHVDIVGGAHAGRFGIADDFAILPGDGGAPVVLVRVDVWHGEQGRLVGAFYKPEELARRKVTPITAEMLELARVEQELEDAL